MMVEEHYRRLEEVFSKASSIYDKRILANFVNVNVRKIEVETLLHYAPRANIFLEVGCGTGEEARQVLRRTGKRVVGIDIAKGMIDYATEKMSLSGLAERFEGRVLRASELSSLSCAFDAIYSFNGALNTERDLPGFFRGLLQVTHQGSIVVLSLRNSRCLGEKLLYTILGRREVIGRRRGTNGHRVEVEVVGESVESTYYGPQEFLRLVPPEFTLLKMKGLAILFPYYLADRVRWRWLKVVISLAERTFCGGPYLRGWGDQTLYVLRRR